MSHAAPRRALPEHSELGMCSVGVVGCNVIGKNVRTTSGIADGSMAVRMAQIVVAIMDPSASRR